VSSEKPIEVAILGSGQMGQNILRHLEESPLVRGITIFDVDPERMQKLKQGFGVKTAATLEGVLQDPEIKLVFVTASNSQWRPHLWTRKQWWKPRSGQRGSFRSDSNCVTHTFTPP
jgi:predicted dehydrogenase